MGDDRLFLGQLQTPGLQKSRMTSLASSDLFCRRRDDKVIGIPHQVDLAFVVDKCTDLTLWHLNQSGHSGLFAFRPTSYWQVWGDDAALGVPASVGNSSSRNTNPGFQKLFQYRFVHGDMLNEPVVADMVKHPLMSPSSTHSGE